MLIVIYLNKREEWLSPVWLCFHFRVKKCAAACLSWVLPAGRWRSGGVSAVQADVDRPVAGLELWLLLLSRFSSLHILLELSCHSGNTAYTHSNPQWQPNGKWNLTHRINLYYIFIHLLLRSRLTVGLSCRFSTFPDSFIDEDPQKALEVNISVS